MPTKIEWFCFLGDIVCCFILSILVSLVIYLFLEVFSRMEKGSIRSDDSASIPGELSTTTVRKFCLIRLIAPEGINVGAVEFKNRLDKCFTVRILLFQENPVVGYRDITLGIFSPDASKHNAEKRLRSVLLPEFPDPIIFFKKGWGAVASHFSGVYPKRTIIFGAPALREAELIVRGSRKQSATRRKKEIRSRRFLPRNSILKCMIWIFTYQFIHHLLEWRFPLLLCVIYEILKAHIKELRWGAEPVPSSVPPEPKLESEEGWILFFFFFTFILACSFDK
jgi:hypothetical protein